MSQIIRGYAWQPWRYQSTGTLRHVTRTRTVTESVTVTEPRTHWAIEQTAWNEWTLRCTSGDVTTDHATLTASSLGDGPTVGTISANGYTVLMRDTISRMLDYLWSRRHE